MTNFGSRGKWRCRMAGTNAMHTMHTMHRMHAHLAGDRDEVCQDAATHGHLGLHEDQSIIHLSFNIVKQRQGAPCQTEARCARKADQKTCCIWPVHNDDKDTHVRYADMHPCHKDKHIQIHHNNIHINNACVYVRTCTHKSKVYLCFLFCVEG